MKKYCLFILAFVTLLVQGQSIVRQVDNLSDLANYGDGFQGSYNVKYGYAEGDGLGGVFFYDPNGAASTNIFNVIDSVLVPGQWVRSDTIRKELLAGDASGSPYTGFKAPATLGGNVVYTLPTTDGAAGQVLSTDGSLVLSWDNAATLASDDLGEIAGTKLIGPALYFRGAGPNDYVEVADDSKLTFSSSAEFGTNSSGTWSPDDNTPALTDGTGTTNQHYRVDSGAGTVTQGASTLSIINGTATTAGQAVYYDGSVWRLKDVDDLPFSVSAWVKMNDATSFIILSKDNAATAREYRFSVNGSDRLELKIASGASDNEARQSTDALTSYEGKWIHVAATFGGAGGPYDTAIVNAEDAISLYVNGKAVSTITASSGTYSGQSDTSQVVYIGRIGSTYAKGHISKVQIFNYELSATEVAQLAKGNDLGFADEWAGALGGVYTSDFSNPDVGGDEDLDGWTGDVRLTSAGNIDSVGPVGDLRDDNLRLTVTDTTSNTHYTTKTGVTTPNKRHRLTAEVYIPSTNSNVDGIRIGDTISNSLYVNATAPTLNTWVTVSGEGIANNATFLITLQDGGNITFQDVGGDDVAYVRNIKVTEIGTLADFRAESFDSDTGKLYDLSTNAYVGVNSGAVITGRSYPVYETGTWTPSVTFGGGSTGITYTTQEGHYTRFGNWVSVHAYILLSAKGSDTGTALVNGLPFTARNTAASSHSLSVGNMLNAANLTSAVTAYVTDNGTTINLTDWGATGVAVLDDTNFAATTSISITGMYQIQ